jgi:drug/metabolite transporter (DMT)-like permease
MMTLAFALIAIACFLLWRRNAQWSWALVMAALFVGVIIFVGDVDFGAKLGVQL